jgi:hypothetical protein
MDQDKRKRNENEYQDEDAASMSARRRKLNSDAVTSEVNTEETPDSTTTSSPPHDHKDQLCSPASPPPEKAEPGYHATEAGLRAHSGLCSPPSETSDQDTKLFEPPNHRIAEPGRPILHRPQDRLPRSPRTCNLSFTLQNSEEKQHTKHSHSNKEDRADTSFVNSYAYAISQCRILLVSYAPTRPFARYNDVNVGPSRGSNPYVTSLLDMIEYWLNTLDVNVAMAERRKLRDTTCRWLMSDVRNEFQAVDTLVGTEFELYARMVGDTDLAPEREVETEEEEEEHKGDEDSDLEHLSESDEDLGEQSGKEEEH